jgi:hypothetical protein
MDVKDEFGRRYFERGAVKYSPTTRYRKLLTRSGVFSL